MLTTSLLSSLLFLGSVAGLPVQDVHQESGIHDAAVSPRAINPIYADLVEYKPHGYRDLAESGIIARDEPDWTGFAVPGEKRAIMSNYADVAEYKPTSSSAGDQLRGRDNDDWANFAIPGEKRAINPIYADQAEYKPHGSHFQRQLEVTVEEVVEEEWKSWTAPSAINPIYLNVSHSDVYKRADSGPIYGSSGKPNIKDVHQTTNPSCGFASVMAAVANANPDWIGTHVIYAPSLSGASSAKISMYDDNLNEKDFTITCGETAEKSDVDASTGVWWPGAYDHAGVKLGLPNQNGAMGPILPANSLQAITGKKATGTDKISADTIFDLAVKSASSKTPAILQTKGSGVNTLVGNHAYALLSGEGSGSDRKVTLYNPWGSYVTASVDSLVPETLYLWYLTNYDSFSGESGGGQTDDGPKTSENVQPAPQPEPTSSRRWGGSGGRGGRTTAAPQPTQVEANEDDVVWVTEVVTVYVNA